MSEPLEEEENVKSTVVSHDGSEHSLPAKKDASGVMYRNNVSEHHSQQQQQQQQHQVPKGERADQSLDRMENQAKSGNNQQPQNPPYDQVERARQRREMESKTAAYVDRVKDTVQAAPDLYCGDRRPSLQMGSSFEQQQHHDGGSPSQQHQSWENTKEATKRFMNTVQVEQDRATSRSFDNPLDHPKQWPEHATHPSDQSSTSFTSAPLTYAKETIDQAKNKLSEVVQSSSTQSSAARNQAQGSVDVTYGQQEQQQREDHGNAQQAQDQAGNSTWSEAKDKISSTLNQASNVQPMKFVKETYQLAEDALNQATTTSFNPEQTARESWNQVKDSAAETLNQAKQSVSHTYNQAKNTAGQVLDQAQGSANELYERSNASNLVNPVNESYNQASSSMNKSNAMNDLNRFDRAREYSDNTWNRGGGADEAKGPLTQSYQRAGDVINNAKDSISERYNQVKDSANQAWDHTKGSVNERFDQAMRQNPWHPDQSSDRPSHLLAHGDKNSSSWSSPSSQFTGQGGANNNQAKGSMNETYDQAKNVANQVVNQARDSLNQTLEQASRPVQYVKEQSNEAMRQGPISYAKDTLHQVGRKLSEHWEDGTSSRGDHEHRHHYYPQSGEHDFDAMWADENQFTQTNTHNNVGNRAGVWRVEGSAAKLKSSDAESSTLDRVKEMAGKVPETISESASAAREALRHGVGYTASTVAEVAGGGMEQIQRTGESILEGVNQAVSSTGETLNDGKEKVKDMAFGTANTVREGVGKAVERAGEVITGGVKSTGEQLQGGASDAMNRAKDAVGHTAIAIGYGAQQTKNTLLMKNDDDQSTKRGEVNGDSYQQQQSKSWARNALEVAREVFAGRNNRSSSSNNPVPSPSSPPEEDDYIGQGHEIAGKNKERYKLNQHEGRPHGTAKL